MRLMLATKNRHKCEEIRSILANTPMELISLLDRPDLPEPGEDGSTLQENALQKATETFQRTGVATIADDSGLEVDALGGGPGVRSRRFTEAATDEANNEKLLQMLEDVEQRAARFRCVIALVGPGFSGTVEGTCNGKILRELRGKHGFGYDPLFVPDEADGEHTLAELGPEVKNQISHRARALALLPDLLRRAGL